MLDYFCFANKLGYSMNNQDFIALGLSKGRFIDGKICFLDSELIAFAKKLEGRLLDEVVRIESLRGWNGVVNMINTLKEEGLS